MPKRTRLNDALGLAFRAVRRFQAAVLSLSDLWYQFALLPFRRSRIAGRPDQDLTLVNSTDALNQAAEHYFFNYEDTEYLLNKPYSDIHNFSRHLINAGIIIDALQVVPGDSIVELGAGSCWLSHMLNLYGCRTASVDVSPTAVRLGRQLFERDPRTKWSLEPRFETYDGHRLPLPTGGFDRIVVNDAFHHVPNQREVLTEMYRVLKPDGLVVMSEPGRGHASAAASTEEMARSGVLENELVLENVAALARTCGFSRVNVVVASPSAHYQIDATRLGAFLGGKRFTAYWKAFSSALEQHHYIVLYKSTEYTTRHPGLLRARIELKGSRTTCQVPAGATRTLTIRLSNAGDTTWLHAPDAGWTRLGAHLYRNAGQPLELVEYDWLRVSLPKDLRPGERVDITVDLPPIRDPGLYTVAFDMVIEGVAWFGDRGSESACAQMVIQ